MACHALIDHRALPLTRKAQEGAFGVKCFSRIRTTCRALLDDKSLWGKLDRQAVSHVFPVPFECFTSASPL